MSIAAPNCCQRASLRAESTSLLHALGRSRGVGQLLVEGSAVLDAPLQELRPLRNRGDGIRLLRKEAPEGRVVPAEILLRAVAVLADAAAQLLRLGNELIA